ncbi:ATP-binding cassette domain-containing protein [bacterium]|nr:ATP-binding cassette domain-containing protein [bacterium]NBX72145.1 ATP-binding cassette domain-containing protein [bacterium]
MLILENIKKTFYGAFEPVLKNINLKLLEHDFCVIIGANGSGKSTLLKTIVGDYPLDGGRIMINRYDMTKKDRSHLIAQVVQDVNKGTVPEMTLLENMVLSRLRGYRKTFSCYDKYQDQILNELKEIDIGLEQFIHYRLQHLSGGQRQMIATIMSINSQAKLLLLDEHTSALDPKMQRILMDYTANAIKKRGLTTLMITHKLDDAIRYGNRLIMLHKGQIVLDVTGEKKATMTITELLDLFHQYEDIGLISKDAHDS